MAELEWRLSEEQYEYLLNEIDILRDRVRALEPKEE